MTTRASHNTSYDKQIQRVLLLQLGKNTSVTVFWTWVSAPLRFFFLFVDARDFVFTLDLTESLELSVWHKPRSEVHANIGLVECV